MKIRSGSLFALFKIEKNVQLIFPYNESHPNKY